MLFRSSAKDFIIVFLMVAVLPAIGEELLFRGMIQNLLGEITNRKHISVIITAFLFSAIHMQFFGFVPRFLLGMLLGFLFEWSGSLWWPVIAHFANNGSAVVFTYLYKHNMLSFDPDKLGTGSKGALIAGISLFLCGVIIWRLREMVEKREAKNV